MISILLRSAILFSLIAVPAYGKEKPEQGQVFITPYLVYLDNPDHVKLGSGPGYGIGLGYAVTDRLSLELTRSQFSDVPDGDVYTSWLSALYGLGSGDNWRPYFVVGGGLGEYDPPTTPNIDLDQYFAGFGAFRDIGTRVSLRGDVRAVWSGGKLDSQAFVGLTAFLGAMTPDVPPDGDGDGVPDGRDRCPNTPAGRAVGSDGCERDSDGDGVTDANDRCPNTPSGVEVDERGCPLDADGDGVPDFRDACAVTERGAKVDARGCYIELEETITIDLNLEFDTNSSALRPEHASEIADVVAFLRRYPSANAVIEGHTDSTGADNYNQALSERRAASVRNYLIERANIDGDRLRSIGYGESRPITTNDTQEGRQRNRRVSAKISGTQKVRQ